VTDSEKIQELETRIKSLESEREKMWQAINSLRHNPAIDQPRMDRIMQQRYGVRPQLASR